MDSKTAVPTEESENSFFAQYQKAEIHHVYSSYIAFTIAVGVFLWLLGASPLHGFFAIMLHILVSAVVYMVIYCYCIHRFVVTGKEGVLTVVGNDTILAPGEEKRYFVFPSSAHTAPFCGEVSVNISLPLAESGEPQQSAAFSATAKVTYEIDPNFIHSPSLHHWEYCDLRDGLLRDTFVEAIEKEILSMANSAYKFFNHAPTLWSDPLRDFVKKYVDSTLLIQQQKMPIRFSIASYVPRAGQNFTPYKEPARVLH